MNEISCTTTCPHTHSAEEAAQLVGGVSALTLRRKAGRGEIPSVKVGREIRFACPRDIEAAIKAGSRTPAPPRRDSRRRS